MTPEELEELRALAGRLSGTAYNENLAAILGAALEHIHKQEEQLDNTRAVLSQVAALQEIAVSERANTLFNGPWDGGLPVGASYDATMAKAKEDARRQLEEKHPEAFR